MLLSSVSHTLYNLKSVKNKLYIKINNKFSFYEYIKISLNE